MLISDSYRSMNAVLHKRHDTYGMSGRRWADRVMQLCEEFETRDVLDYGAGKGSLQAAIPWTIQEYDPAVRGKDALPTPADIVVCTDVLEHIEPECLDDVLDNIAGLTKKAAFLVIATRPAKKVLPDGRNAHLIIKPPPWWLVRLKKRFIVSSSKGDKQRGEIRFVVKPVGGY